MGEFEVGDIVYFSPVDGKGNPVNHYDSSGEWRVERLSRDSHYPVAITRISDSFFDVARVRELTLVTDRDATEFEFDI